MQILSGLFCPTCSRAVEAECQIDTACHDNSFIDIVITCPECKTVFNYFIEVDDLTVVPESN